MLGLIWEKYSTDGHFPDGAIRSGTDNDGTPIYVGRALHEGVMVPAKVIPIKKVAYIPYDGAEVAKSNVEVLRAGIVAWEPHANGSVPDDAVIVGNAADGENLYYGRCLYEGSQTPGKIQVSHNCLYIPYNGEEVAISEYEVLVLK